MKRRAGRVRVGRVSGVSAPSGDMAGPRPGPPARANGPASTGRPGRRPKAPCRPCVSDGLLARAAVCVGSVDR